MPPLASPQHPLPHRLMEGLHHGLGVVGVVVHHGLLQSLVVELLHVLGDLGEGCAGGVRSPHHRDLPWGASIHLALPRT